MAARKLPSTRKILSGDYDRDIFEGMARAMYVSDWANRQEEKGISLRGELMDQAPATSPDARAAAKVLTQNFLKANKVKSLTDLYAMALNAGASGRKGDAGTFGHYLAMQAMGHGVSWFDDHPKFPLVVPYFEYYSGRGRVAQKLGRSSGRAGRSAGPVSDWLVKKVELSQRSVFHVSGENLNFAKGHMDRAFHWNVEDLEDPRYDLSSASFSKPALEKYMRMLAKGKIKRPLPSQVHGHVAGIEIMTHLLAAVAGYGVAQVVERPEQARALALQGRDRLVAEGRRVGASARKFAGRAAGKGLFVPVSSSKRKPASKASKVEGPYRRRRDSDTYAYGGLRGEITTSYTALEKVLGKPMPSEGDGDKVTTAWRFVDATNPTKQFWVYDWKVGRSYDRDGLTKAVIRSRHILDWHIGSGALAEDVAVFADWLAEQTGGSLNMTR